MKQLFLRFCLIGAFVAAVALAASPMANADYYNPGYYGTPVLSQTSVSVGTNQAATVTISGGSLPYTMYYATPNLFQAVISGNTLQVTGLNTGSGSLSVCSSGGSASGCATLYVTVGGGNYYPPYPTPYPTPYYTPYPTPYPPYNSQIVLSQTNVTLNNGSATSIGITGNGSYYVSSNTNSSVVTASINGSTLNVSGLSYGNATITICQNSGGQCATVYVTVSYNGGGYPNPNSPSLITFSQTNPALSVSQSMNISLYGSTNDGYYNGSNGYYYIGYNSNSNSLQATISGSNLSLQGLAAGNVVVVVCSSATNCAALTATVGGTTVVPTGTGNWYPCASENQFCSFSGTQTVQYGANGVYVYKTLANGTTCSNAVFGDPIFGIAKRCNISY